MLHVPAGYIFQENVSKKQIANHAPRERSGLTGKRGAHLPLSNSLLPVAPHSPGFSPDSLDQLFSISTVGLFLYLTKASPWYWPWALFLSGMWMQWLTRKQSLKQQSSQTEDTWSSMTGDLLLYSGLPTSRLPFCEK